MGSVLRFFRGVNVLLVFVPLSIGLHYSSFGHHHPLWLFVTAALAIIPLAGLLGTATEELSKCLGPTWGGLLNATFGNMTELIIGFFALAANQLALVRASIVGSIIGNILLVLGLSILAGGLKHKVQTFNQDQAESHSINLLLASLSLAIPALFAASYHHSESARDPDILDLSLWVAGILLLLYVASLWFSLRTHENLFRGGEEEEWEPPVWSTRRSFAVLIAATALIALESEFLVSTVGAAARGLGFNYAFIGIIIVAIIGNAAEHATAVMMAVKNKMDITMNIAIGSSIQVAMFVAPVLVFFSLLVHHPLSFIFNVPELTAIGFSVLIAAFIAGDGKCHWLEGAQLLAAYAIIAVAFFFLPPDVPR